MGKEMIRCGLSSVTFDVPLGVDATLIARDSRSKIPRSQTCWADDDACTSRLLLIPNAVIQQDRLTPGSRSPEK